MFRFPENDGLDSGFRSVSVSSMAKSGGGSGGGKRIIHKAVKIKKSLISSDSDNGRKIEVCQPIIEYEYVSGDDDPYVVPWGFTLEADDDADKDRGGTDDSPKDRGLKILTHGTICVKVKVHKKSDRWVIPIVDGEGKVESTDVPTRCEILMERSDSSSSDDSSSSGSSSSSSASKFVVYDPAEEEEEESGSQGDDDDGSGSGDGEGKEEWCIVSLNNSQTKMTEEEAEELMAAGGVVGGYSGQFKTSKKGQSTGNCGYISFGGGGCKVKSGTCEVDKEEESSDCAICVRVKMTTGKGEVAPKTKKWSWMPAMSTMYAFDEYEVYRYFPVARYKKKGKKKILHQVQYGPIYWDVGYIGDFALIPMINEHGGTCCGILNSGDWHASGTLGRIVIFNGKFYGEHTIYDVKAGDNFRDNVQYFDGFTNIYLKIKLKDLMKAEPIVDGEGGRSFQCEIRTEPDEDPKYVCWWIGSVDIDKESGAVIQQVQQGPIYFARASYGDFEMDKLTLKGGEVWITDTQTRVPDTSLDGQEGVVYANIDLNKKTASTDFEPSPPSFAIGYADNTREVAWSLSRGMFVALKTAKCKCPSDSGGGNNGEGNDGGNDGGTGSPNDA